MDIEQAKSVPLTVILDTLGNKPTQQENNEIKYPSIFSNNKTGNLIINTDTNTWHDSSTGKNGDTISLVTSYLEFTGADHTQKDALRWIGNMCGYALMIQPVSCTENIPSHAGLKVIGSSRIQSADLIRHIESLGFPVHLAQRYIREIRVYDKPAGKTFRALGLRNEDGGYYAFSPSFAGFVGKANITFIRGTAEKSDSYHIFKDAFDFLAALAGFRNGRPFEDPAIILNSYANLPKVTACIQGYSQKKTVFSWMTNDASGQEATGELARFSQSEPGLEHFAMNGKYAPYESVYAWHTMQTLRSAL
jgi:hypothetical protein